MITPENVRKTVNSINNDDFECRFTNRMNLIEDYIDQQEKKERLLGLYDEYIHIMNFDSTNIFDIEERIEYINKRIRKKNELYNQIQRLKEELK